MEKRNALVELDIDEMTKSERIVDRDLRTAHIHETTHGVLSICSVNILCMRESCLSIAYCGA
jgi:hypothetical protein